MLGREFMMGEMQSEFCGSSTSQQNQVGDSWSHRWQFCERRMEDYLYTALFSGVDQEDSILLCT